MSFERSALTDVFIYDELDVFKKLQTANANWNRLHE